MEDDKNSSQKGIFSTPGLTVDTEKLVRPVTSSRYSQQSPAASKASALNDGRKSRRKIILIISFILVALIAIVAAIITVSQSNNHDTSTSTSSAGVAQTQFNRYATWALFGESRDNFNEQYDPRHNYRLSAEYGKEPTDAGYWDKATELLNTAVSSYELVNAPQDDALFNNLQSYKSKFDFLKSYRAMGDISESQLISNYFTGMDAAEAYVENYYAPLLDAGFYDAQALVEQKIEYYSLYLRYIQMSDTNGCIKDGKVAKECTGGGKDVANIEEYLNLLSEMNVANNAATGIALDIVDELETQCWTIRSAFTDAANGTDENDSEED